MFVRVDLLTIGSTVLILINQPTLSDISLVEVHQAIIGG